MTITEAIFYLESLRVMFKEDCPQHIALDMAIRDLLNAFETNSQARQQLNPLPSTFRQVQSNTEYIGFSCPNCGYVRFSPIQKDVPLGDTYSWGGIYEGNTNE